MENIKEISQIIKNIESQANIVDFFKELLTKSELETLSKRWHILKMLKKGIPQRQIAKELQVSLCKITRGAKILKDNNSILAKHLIKE